MNANEPLFSAYVLRYESTDLVYRYWSAPSVASARCLRAVTAAWRRTRAAAAFTVALVPVRRRTRPAAAPAATRPTAGTRGRRPTRKRPRSRVRAETAARTRVRAAASAARSG